MIYKNKPECKTIATYVPVETYVELMNMADAQDVNTQNLVKAMYAYHLAAVAYVA